jgi:hypothetical protein
VAFYGSSLGSDVINYNFCRDNEIILARIAINVYVECLVVFFLLWSQALVELTNLI